MNRWTLYNKACQISAIKTFRQVAVGEEEEDDDSEDEGNNMIDEDETMEDSEAVRPSNADYGFDWETWK
ncbi:hypothetical protein O181_030116 [Austropuccinia psidii MF-1]|uniref:Uncharacterized protein n=1 Tax=Austropuccinia psidii MF-1 TaxID=1389203 RepID=A0A9Q3CXU2_9BASI|nr:hypothetical protein [Austropuccinia psidii MF-1]